MKKGFTLVELIVVIGMLMVLAGSVTTAVASARRRAKIAKATATCQEITNAILAYENYAQDYSLETKATGDSWKEATRGNLGFILGDETAQMGEDKGKIPVLYNAEIKGTAILDPWGRQYWYKIARRNANIEETAEDRAQLKTGVLMLNYYRRRPWEDD